MGAKSDFFKRGNDEFRDTAVKHIKKARIRFKNVSNILSTRFGTTDDCSNLVKIFGKCVEHVKYTRNNSIETTGKENCLQFVIAFPSIGKEVTLYCNKSKDQPGNGEIDDGKPYSDYENETADGFAIFFKQFLQGQIKNTEQDFDMKFELSILLAFEIARRLPEGPSHPYRDVPVAAAIYMAVTMSSQPQELFNVFRRTREQRMSAFREIHAKYKQEGHSDPTAKDLFDMFIGGAEAEDQNQDENDNGSDAEENTDIEDRNNDDGDDDDEDDSDGGQRGQEMDQMSRRIESLKMDDPSEGSEKIGTSSSSTSSGARHQNGAKKS